MKRRTKDPWVTKLHDEFQGKLEAFAKIPRKGARDLPILNSLRGPTNRSVMQMENAISEAVDIFRESGRVYQFGENLVVESTRSDGAAELVIIRTGRTVERNAGAIMANLFVCEGKLGQFSPPDWFVGPLLVSEQLGFLPQIRTYAIRPVFDTHFHLCGPGYHAESGIMIHGPAIEPVEYKSPDVNRPARDRLPPRLGQLLGDFPFLSDADVANAVGAFLTGILSNHFITDPKSIVLINGNQPSIGKSLLAQVIGIVVDGQLPHVSNYTEDDAELRKIIGAFLPYYSRTTFILDNASLKGFELASSALESISVAPRISERVLGKSAFVTRDNDIQWIITVNNARANADTLARSAVIQLFVNGEPQFHTAKVEPLRFAMDNRDEILAELMGMVDHWVRNGRTYGNQIHRNQFWARTIGGILSATGFPEFLTNAAETKSEISSQLDLAASLAEAAVRLKGPYVEGPLSPEVRPPEAKRAAEWNTIVNQVATLQQRFMGSSERARASAIGKLLSPLTGQVVPIQVGNQTGTAVLRQFPGRAGAVSYVFEVLWVPDRESGEADRQPVVDELHASTAPTSPDTLPVAASRPVPTPPDQVPATEGTSTVEVAGDHLRPGPGSTTTELANPASPAAWC